MLFQLRDLDLLQKKFYNIFYRSVWKRFGMSDFIFSSNLTISSLHKIADSQTDAHNVLKSSLFIICDVVDNDILGPILKTLFCFSWQYGWVHSAGLEFDWLGFNRFTTYK